MEDATLRREAQLLSRHLLAVDPPDEVVGRYVEAHAARIGAGSRRDRAVMALVHERPALLPALDAAAALAARESLLRHKLVLIAAILETTPALAPRFEPPSAGRAFTLARLALHGLAGAASAVVGLLVYAVVAARDS